MNIITDLISSVKSSTSDFAIQDVLVGLHWTSVSQSGRRAWQPLLDDAPCCHSQDIDWVGKLQQHSVLELVNLIFSDHPLEVSIGMAALNSLITINKENCVELNARDLLLERSQSKKVAIIGHFPFAEAFRKTATDLWVLELEPALGEYPASAADDLLPQADVIGLTATTIMNGTFEHLYPLFPDKALVVMMGPSTPMNEVLFDYGVDILAGRR